MSVNITPGSWSPTFGPSGVTSPYGAARQYRDGIFIRSVFLKELAIAQRLNEMVIAREAGTRVPQVTSKKGQRYTLPTKSIPAVGDVTTAFTTSSYSYPDYVAIDTFTATGDRFTQQIGSGTSVMGIPVPLQRMNEGEVELLINQYRGLGMAFTREYLEISMLESPSQYYAEMIKYAMNNDMERYLWLTCLYTGPLTETADDYGTLFNDAIGITNRASYQLTRTLSAVGTGSNLITPNATGSAPSMTNPGNSRFGTSPANVPWLFGTTTSDISYSTIVRLSEKFENVNVPLGQRKLIMEAKGYTDVSHLPQFQDIQIAGGDAAEKVNTTGRMGKIHTFDTFMTNVIQPTGSSSNVLYELAAGPDALAYGVQREPDLIIDDMLNKKEQALVLMSTARYGAVVKRPDHIGIIQTRTRIA